MARVNLDGKIWKDPRVRRLARRRKWSMRETVGTLAAVWDVAYDSKSSIMSALDVDTAAETDGFAAELVLELLADQENAEDVRLRGIEERIQYLIAQAERGRQGGRNRMANAERTASGRLASSKQTPGECQANAKHIPDLPLDPDLDKDPDRDTDIPTSSEPNPLRLSSEPSGKRTKARKPNAGPMPEGWTPNADAAAKARVQGLDLRATAEHFRDHHAAKGSRFVDWDAAFRTWLGNALRFGARSSSSARNNPTETALQTLREHEAREGIPHAAEASS